MKRMSKLLIAVLCSITIHSQDGEFKVYSNGLIYSEHTMSKLSHIVDSLNLMYRTCDFNKVFYGKQQAIGLLVKMTGGNIKAARNDIRDNISFEDFLGKYPEAVIQKDVLIVKWKYKNYKDQQIVEFEHIDLNRGSAFSIQTEKASLYYRNMAKTWLHEYTEKSNYRKESLTAFYFPSDFTAPTIPKNYSMMIGYSDCLIDTTTTKLKEDLSEEYVPLQADWTSLSYRKKAELLERLRSTRVIGRCSMDNSPRNHAVNIALLSAETYNWGVFLKAHLDIMNDRFDRRSDGSYAWAQRATYIKELENLNINVRDLLLGICLRVENPATNHYYGNTSRIGRALSETQNRAEIEAAILSIVSDTELDLFNRTLFYFLFRNYNSWVTDESVKQENKKKLAAAVKTFPGNMGNEMEKIIAGDK